MDLTWMTCGSEADAVSESWACCVNIRLTGNNEEGSLIWRSVWGEWSNLLDCSRLVVCSGGLPVENSTVCWSARGIGLRISRSYSLVWWKMGWSVDLKIVKETKHRLNEEIHIKRSNYNGKRSSHFIYIQIAVFPAFAVKCMFYYAVQISQVVSIEILIS